jgi:Uma2 family endonuclease
VKLTYADYAALPDDGLKYELHEGELSVTPAPGTRHQLVIGNLHVLLREHVRVRGLGQVLLSPTDCIMSDITVVQPAIVYVAPAHGERISERAIEGSPTLAIEVISPSSERIDRRRKLDLYARHGVLYYWIVDPTLCSIDAYVLAEGVFQLAAQLAGDAPRALPPFDELVLDPAEVWA